MSDKSLPLYADHGRIYRQNKFVYPVLSRRSGGISIGVNLNPDKVCNFDCIYCQVDRRSEAETNFVETDRLWEELDSMLEFVSSGRIYDDPKFAHVPVIMLSSKDGLFDKARGRMVGSEDYLTKPFTKEQLLRAVDSHRRAPR